MMSEHFIHSVNDIEISAYVDSYKSGEKFHGKDILNPDYLKVNKDAFVVVAVNKAEDIISVLENYGFEEGEDYISYRKILGQPSRLIRKTIFDRNYYDLTCNTMLNHLEILNNGNTRPCCTTFIEHDLDNVLDNSVEDIWQSPLHRVLCLSTENHTFCFCDKSMCPLFVNKEAKKGGEVTSVYKEMSTYPTTLALGYDKTCNLYCETCRDGVCVAKGEEKKVVDNITEKVICEYLPDTEFLIMAGDGEVMLSKAYKKVYTSSLCKPKYIRLLSNGMLFNPKHWDEIRGGKNCPIMLTVSVDAATKETYESIRRGGNFDILKKNMEFAAQLRKSGELRYFRMNFVVQNRNYLEMPLFVEWGEELGVDEVFFTKVLNWGTWSSEEFKSISMMEEDGSTPKVDLKKILDDPRMKSPIVDLGTIRYLHKADDVGIVDNYYKWELEKRGGKIFD